MEALNEAKLASGSLRPGRQGTYCTGPCRRPIGFCCADTTRSGAGTGSCTSRRPSRTPGPTRRRKPDTGSSGSRAGSPRNGRPAGTGTGCTPARHLSTREISLDKKVTLLNVFISYRTRPRRAGSCCASAGTNRAAVGTPTSRCADPNRTLVDGWAGTVRGKGTAAFLSRPLGTPRPRGSRPCCTGALLPRRITTTTTTRAALRALCNERPHEANLALRQLHLLSTCDQSAPFSQSSTCRAAALSRRTARKVRFRHVDRVFCRKRLAALIQSHRVCSGGGVPSRSDGSSEFLRSQFIITTSRNTAQTRLLVYLGTPSFSAGCIPARIIESCVAVFFFYTKQNF